MIVTLVAGARPNFMKIAPVIKAIKAQQQLGEDIIYRLVHTGQHYDNKMSGNFFQELGIPQPHTNLEAGSGTQAEQTAAVMTRFETELSDNRPDVVLVVGDVTSTMACTITAKKMCIDVAHVEAGIRSGDMTMPEEINRIVTDAICDHYFTTSVSANENLHTIGVKDDRIHFVGNTMSDTLYQNIEKLQQPSLWESHSLQAENYFLLTLHRPANVDDTNNLKHVLDVILANTDNLPTVFPVHPRTRKMLDSIGYVHAGLIQADPMSYLEFVFLLKNAKAVITDSGGITEEATVLNIPCFTLRDSTERPETVTLGTNELIGTNPSNLIPYFAKLKSGKWKKSTIPLLWDGNAAHRIVRKLIDLYHES